MTAAPTDGELAALVAEHVAGWKHVQGHTPYLMPWKSPDGKVAYECDGTFPPPYATSADAVLPLLEKEKDWCWYASPGRFEVHITIRDIASVTTCEVAATFPRAACRALLRAHGVTGIDSRPLLGVKRC